MRQVEIVGQGVGKEFPCTSEVVDEWEEVEEEDGFPVRMESLYTRSQPKFPIDDQHKMEFRLFLELRNPRFKARPSMLTVTHGVACGDHPGHPRGYTGPYWVVLSAGGSPPSGTCSSSSPTSSHLSNCSFP